MQVRVEVEQQEMLTLQLNQANSTVEELQEKVAYVAMTGVCTHRPAFKELRGYTRGLQPSIRQSFYGSQYAVMLLLD